MPSILHVASDEKFINFANWSFEKAFKGSNDFAIILPSQEKKLKFVAQKKNIFTVIINNSTIDCFISTFDKYDLIVLHGMSYEKSRLVLKYKHKSKLIWMFLGFEIYSNPLALGKTVLGNKTLKWFPFTNELIGFFKELFRRIYYQFNYLTSSPNKSILNAIHQIEHIGILHKEDFIMLRDKNFISNKAKHLKYTYYPIEAIIKGLQDYKVNNDNILFGNSASKDNNHLEGFELLKKIPLANRKIISPLNYGSHEYADVIIEIGLKEFKSNFVPIREFLSLSDYNKLVQQCGIVVMNHYRQQAVGNIVLMLWIGSKVYLDERNSIFQYLKRIGIIVFSIAKDLTPENDKVFELLTDTEVEKNRSILINEFGEEEVLTKLKNQIETIINES